MGTLPDALGGRRRRAVLALYSAHQHRARRAAAVGGWAHRRPDRFGTRPGQRRGTRRVGHATPPGGGNRRCVRRLDGCRRARRNRARERRGALGPGQVCAPARGRGPGIARRRLDRQSPAEQRPGAGRGAERSARAGTRPARSAHGDADRARHPDERARRCRTLGRGHRGRLRGEFAARGAARRGSRKRAGPGRRAQGSAVSEARAALRASDLPEHRRAHSGERFASAPRGAVHPGRRAGVVLGFPGGPEPHRLRARPARGGRERRAPPRTRELGRVPVEPPAGGRARAPGRGTRRQHGFLHAAVRGRPQILARNPEHPARGGRRENRALEGAELARPGGPAPDGEHGHFLELAGAASAMKVEPEALGGPIGAAALRRLLAPRGPRRELAEVRHALERAGEPRFAGGREALVALSAALGGLGATRVRLAATRADMLSERHLPALVEHEGRTWVLRELRGGRRLLDPGDGNPREVDQAALAEAFALWLDHPGEATEREGRSTAGRLLARALAARRRLLGEVALATLLTILLALAISVFARH